jgi:hypothetical protein
MAVRGFSGAAFAFVGQFAARLGQPTIRLHRELRSRSLVGVAPDLGSRKRVDKLGAMRGKGESYSDAILRVPGAER